MTADNNAFRRDNDETKAQCGTGPAGSKRQSHRGIYKGSNGMLYSADERGAMRLSTRGEE